MNRRALITGISGQDGSYLAEHLVYMGYDVHGIIRRQSTPEHQESRIAHLDGQITTHYGDVLDMNSLIKLIAEYQFNEIYNLAGQSHVRISFDIPDFTIQTNAVGVHNVISAARLVNPTARIYQASSSEMFGNQVDPDGFQRLTTPMRPVSPYGAAKLFGFNIARVYRQSYQMHICNGILFNHESPRRASNFVTQKIIRGAIHIVNQIERGHEPDKLMLGNLDAKRDWGHSWDYVRAMHLILQHERPRDWIVATGETRSVRDLCRYVFKHFGLDYRDHVATDAKFIRPNELEYLQGDSQAIREHLGWIPKYSFNELINEMISDELARMNKKGVFN